MAVKIWIEKERVIVSSDWLCKELGVTGQTLANWRDDGCPKHKYGQWDLLEVLRWRGAIGNGGALAGAKGSLQEQKLRAEIELKEAQAELQKFKSDLTKGQYMEREFILSELSRFFVVLKRSVLSISRRISQMLMNHVEPVELRRIEKMVDAELTSALEQMSVGGVYHARKK